MYGTEVGIFHETNHICFCSFLQAYDGAPWKHKSYLPTSRAISWTNCKKGSFQMRSSMLFWNCWISQRASVPGWYFLVFFTLPAWRNFFWGLGNDNRDLPTSSSLLASSTHFSASSTCFFSSSLMGEGSLAGDGW